MVRLKDVAAAAGVSLMTVSKALRDQPDIAVATRDRVCEIAKRMGYVPDAVARGLRNQKTHLIGLVIPAATDPIFSRILLAIEERAHDLGYEVLVAQTLGQVAREETVIRRLLARRVDGLIISPVYRLEGTSAVYRQLAQGKTPVVILGQRPLFCLDLAGVESDDAHASAAVTHHLFELGHRRIAYLAGPTVAPWAQERLEGFRRAHRERKLTWNDQWVFSAGNSIEGGSAAALKLLQETHGITAIQAGHDFAAIGVGEILLKQGLSIPKQISLAGFGNTLVAEYFRVPLTTVRQPKHRLGQAAMDLMVQQIAAKRPEVRRLSAEIIVRSSTGHVPPPEEG